MTLEGLGNLGDFIGGIGVIVTLIYLAFQIRQNNALLRMNADLARISSHEASNLHGITARSDLLAEGGAELYLRGLSGDHLEPADQARFDIHLINYLYGMQGIYIRTQVLQDGVWPTQAPRTVAMLSSPGGRPGWERMANLFQPEFREEIARLIGEADVRRRSESSPHEHGD